MDFKNYISLIKIQSQESVSKMPISKKVSKPQTKGKNTTVMRLTKSRKRSHNK